MADLSIPYYFAVASVLAALAPVVLGKNVASWVDKHYDTVTLRLDEVRPLTWFRKYHWGRNLRWVFLVSTITYALLIYIVLGQMLDSGAASVTQTETLRAASCLVALLTSLGIYSAAMTLATLFNKIQYSVAFTIAILAFYFNEIQSLFNTIVMTVISLSGFVFFDSSYCYFDYLAIGESDPGPATIQCDKLPEGGLQDNGIIAAAIVVTILLSVFLPFLVTQVGLYVLAAIFASLSALTEAMKKISYRISDAPGGAFTALFALLAAIFAILGVTIQELSRAFSSP
jgi:hypothetical protein